MAQHTYEQMTRDNCVEIAHYAREIARMIDAGEPLQPWMADLIAKCRSSVGEVKHRMETRSGAIGQPISPMDRIAAGQPIGAMENEAGMSGSQRIRKMRLKNAVRSAEKTSGGSAYSRYMRKKKPARAPVEISAQWMNRTDYANKPQLQDVWDEVKAMGCEGAQGVVFGRMPGQAKPRVLFTTHCPPSPDKATDIQHVQPAGHMKKVAKGKPAVDITLRNGKRYRVIWWSKAFE